MASKAWQGDWSVTQPWGWTSLTLEPPYQGGHWHCGIDIGMPVGTPLYAIRAGKVTRRTSGILGITTGSGQTDYYVHGTYTVYLGRLVAQGALLGTSGAVIPGGGSLTGPHLHFEVQPPGGLLNEPRGLDPVPLLFPGFFSGTGGSIVSDDMTPAQEALLNQAAANSATLVYLVQDKGPDGVSPGTDGNNVFHEFRSRLEALKLDLIKVKGDLATALSAPPGTVDLAPILAEVQALNPKLDAIRAVTDKIAAI